MRKILFLLSGSIWSCSAAGNTSDLAELGAGVFAKDGGAIVDAASVRDAGAQIDGTDSDTTSISGWIEEPLNLSTGSAIALSVPGLLVAHPTPSRRLFVDLAQENSFPYSGSGIVGGEWTSGAFGTLLIDRNPSHPPTVEPSVHSAAYSFAGDPHVLYSHDGIGLSIAWYPPGGGAGPGSPMNFWPTTAIDDNPLHFGGWPPKEIAMPTAGSYRLLLYTSSDSIGRDVFPWSPGSWESFDLSQGLFSAGAPQSWSIEWALFDPADRDHLVIGATGGVRSCSLAPNITGNPACATTPFGVGIPTTEVQVTGAMSLADPNRIYSMTEDQGSSTTEHHLYVSSDRGQNFVARTLPSQSRGIILHPSQSDTLVVNATAQGVSTLYVSKDGGLTFSSLAPPSTGDLEGMAIDAAGTLFVTQAGSLWSMAL